MALYLENKDGQRYKVSGGGGITNIPVATNTVLGGIKSSSNKGSVSVDSEGITSVNDIVTVRDTGDFQLPAEWGDGPWILECTEDDSVDEHNGLPKGGTQGQILTKTSDVDYESEWTTLEASNVQYDNTTSQLTATTTQSAIDEVNTKTNTNTSSLITFGNRIQYYSNRNLLDNWYFINPINQKGQTSYSGSLISIDRWFCRNITLKVNESSCTVISNAAGVSFEQLVSNLDLYRGKTLTLSLLQANNTLNTLTYTIPTTGAFDHGGAKDLVPGNNIYLNFWTTSGIDFFRARIVWQVANIPIEIVAMKLELGTQQTLAHQDADGNWVLNDTPPNYADELYRCWRYYRPIYIISENSAYYATTNTIVSDTHYLEPEMYKTPTVINMGNIVYEINNGFGGWKSDGTASLSTATANKYIRFDLKIPTSVTTNLANCRMFSKVNTSNSVGPIWLDANL